MLIDWRVYVTVLILGYGLFFSAPLRGWDSRYFDFAMKIAPPMMIGAVVFGIIDFIWAH